MRADIRQMKRALVNVSEIVDKLDNLRSAWAYEVPYHVKDKIRQYFSDVKQMDLSKFHFDEWEIDQEEREDQKEDELG